MTDGPSAGHGFSSASGDSVFVADEQSVVPVDGPRFARLAADVLHAEGVDPDVQVAVVFVDRDAITALNRQFLDGDGPTDVLAFPIDDDPPQPGRRPDEGGRGPGSGSDEMDAPTLLGDVYVCPSIAERQARARGIPADDEMALLVVHGLLHLLGRDHAEPVERAEMRARERQLLTEFGALAAPIDTVLRYPDVEVDGSDPDEVDGTEGDPGDGRDAEHPTPDPGGPR